MCYRTADAITLYDQIVASLREDGQIGLVFEPTPDSLTVQHAVGLSAGGAYRRALRRVQDSELDAGFVSGRRHGATQRVNLPHQMAFANTADRRITAHRPQRVHIVGQQQRPAADTSRRESSLGTGVAAADNDDIEARGIEHEGVTGNVQYPAGVLSWEQQSWRGNKYCGEAAILRELAERQQFIRDCATSRHDICREAVGVRQRSCQNQDWKTGPYPPWPLAVNPLINTFSALIFPTSAC